MSEQQDMPLTQAIWALRGSGREGRTLGEVLAGVGMPERREREPEPVDNDERAANLLARGYAPGAAIQLSQRLADTVAELETERAKLEAGQRRQERIHREHQAGRITAFGIARMQDFDEGDQATVERLERRAESLRAQMADMSALISPHPQRTPDPVEAAAQRAQQVFAEAARPAPAPRPARERRPFDGPGGGAERAAYPPGREIVRGGGYVVDVR